MKRYLLLSLICFPVLLIGQVLIKGQINSRKINSVTLSIYSEPINHKQIILAETKPNELGFFQFSVDLLSAQEIFVSTSDIQHEIVLRKDTIRTNANITLFVSPDSEYTLSINKNFEIEKIESEDQANQLYKELGKKLSTGKQGKKKNQIKFVELYQEALETYADEPGFNDYTKYRLLISNWRMNFLQTSYPEGFKALEEQIVLSQPKLANPVYQELLNSMYVRKLHPIKEATKVSPQHTLERMKHIKNDDVRQIARIITHTQRCGRKGADTAKELAHLKKIEEQATSETVRSTARRSRWYYSRTLENEVVPDFAFINQKEDSVKISDFRGKYLVLDFWATWCGPCLKGMKKLPELKEKYADKLEFLCVSSDFTISHMKKFLAKKNYSTLNFAFAGMSAEIDSYFNIQAIPRYVILDPEGRVIKDQILTDLESELEKILNQ